MNIFWILVGLFFVLRSKKYRHYRRFLYAALVWLALTSTRFFPDLLVYGLEKQYNTFDVNDAPNKKTYIHVLGGGGIYDLSLASQERLSGNSLARLSEGVRIYRELKNAKLVFSGYSSTNNVTQAAITKDAAIALGVPEEDILIFEKPTTTEEEAIAYFDNLGKSGAELILVTSDIHMPRAMYLFRKRGLMPIAAPSDHILKWQYKEEDILKSKKNSIPVSHFWWRSHKGNFDKFYSAMHEYLGLFWARI